MRISADRKRSVDLVIARDRVICVGKALCQILRFLCSSAFQRLCLMCVFSCALVVISFAQVNQRQQSGVAGGPAILLLLAVAIFAAGALRYYRHGNFTLVQAGYCLLALLVSLLVLLVFDYTLHHAKIVAVMVLVFVVLYLFASPAFCVGLGLALAGMVMVQARG